MPRAKTVWPLLALLFLSGAPGCYSASAPTPARAITLATTTSTQDSGLLDVLVPMFRDATDIEVKVVAVGSGQALELGRRGDADLLLVHSPDAEQEFVRQGYGLRRLRLMYNDFLIVGPPTDPASLRGLDSGVAAMRQISQHRSRFVSRSDQSGTHVMEQTLWREAKLDRAGDWYLRAGAGMAETLRLADEKDAYTLTDRATYLAQQKNLRLVVFIEGDPMLLNHYSLIPVNPAKLPHVNHTAADRFVKFLFSSEAQQTIARFGQERFGQPLFFLETQ